MYRPSPGPVTLVLLLLLGAVVGCGGDAIIGDDDLPGQDDDDAVEDADGDGDPADTDCDDEDPDVATSLDELCGDGKDNDCDPATVCFLVEQGDDVVAVDPRSGAGSAADWYGYSEDSWMGSHGLDLADSLVVALYRDPDDDLHLMLSVDGVDDDSGGSGSLTITSYGDAAVLVADEPSEYVQGDGVITFAFEWAGCCTDGLVLGPLDADFCVEVTASDVQGLGEGIVVWESATSTAALGPADGSFEVCVGQ